MGVICLHREGLPHESLVDMRYFLELCYYYIICTVVL